MLKRFWRDSNGAMVSSELALVGALLIVGVIAGLSALKFALLTEINDINHAVEAMDFTPTLTTGIPETHEHTHNELDPPVTHTHEHTGAHTHPPWP